MGELERWLRTVSGAAGGYYGWGDVPNDNQVIDLGAIEPGTTTVGQYAEQMAPVNTSYQGAYTPVGGGLAGVPAWAWLALAGVGGVMLYQAVK